MEEAIYSATGGRKTATAFVKMIPGSGKIIVNGRDAAEYFGRDTSVMLIERPLRLTNTLGKFDIFANVRGGGLSGQAGAICLAIAKALLTSDENLKKPLRSAGFLTRDTRMKERKKYGLAGARKKYQHSKR